MILTLLTTFSVVGMAQIMPNNFSFEKLNDNTGLPSYNVTCLYQDSVGFMWIGTQNGLFRYDGCHVKKFKNDRERPHLLTSNNVTAISEGTDKTLWIGTHNGLNCINLQKGDVRHYFLTDFANSNAVNCFLLTQEGTLWVGTDGGLYRYHPESDSFVLYCDQRGNSKVPHCSVVSLMEDSAGYLWIGTWDKGLFRLDTAGEYYEMPKFNDINSAQTVFEDSKNRLWVGTWGKGLYCITNPHETGKPLIFNFFNEEGTKGGLLSDVVWDLHEDDSSRLWIGTNRGLSFITEDSVSTKVYALPKEMEPEPDYFRHGVNSFLRCNNGRIWMYAYEKGIATTSARPANFNTKRLPAEMCLNDRISCASFDVDANLVIGMDHAGLVIPLLENYNNNNPAYSILPIPSKVNAIKSISADSMIVGTSRNGLIMIKKGEIIEQQNKNNTPWLLDNCVYDLKKDAEGNLLIGTWCGLSVRYTNGKGIHLSGDNIKELESAIVYTIDYQEDGTIWMGTREKGIIRLQGDLHNPSSLRCQVYNSLYGSRLQMLNISRVLVDHAGRVLACSEEAGLVRYDADKEGFVSVNRQYGIPDDDVFNIEEDNENNLWISSQYNLMCLSLDTSDEVMGLRFFNKNDVIGADYFDNGFSAISRNGQLCFTGKYTYSLFSQRKFEEKSTYTYAYITDIKISNASVDTYDLNDRKKITSNIPPFIQKVTLSPMQRDIAIEFSSLSYQSPEEMRFSYKLEGFDNEWKYTSVDENQALYSNLPPGNYSFYLCTTNANGSWNKEFTLLYIHVLYPIYQRWYAWLLYVIVVILIIYLVLRYLKNRAKDRHEVEMVLLENSNIEQLNHNKLQFFTNITHDLMTPLTIISTATSNLRQEYPQSSHLFHIIEDNANRLMRMLQQILEFRKSETGNLRLCVSKDNLADFMRKEVESIRPLTKSKHLLLSVICSPKDIIGYFDSDKIDKILYNLISNAAKYNRDMGYIQVTLESKDSLEAFITVKDNGLGISAKKLPQLFERFYEGEYRKFNTYGNGIGLSLTKDLTELHHGSISVESKEGEGSTFVVRIPICREAYNEEEIDDTTLVLNNEPQKGEKALLTNNRNAQTVLVVEDNEELLMLLQNLLGHIYNVLIANNGKEALDIFDNNNIDLIVTDVMMPVMNGNELVRNIRQSSKDANCPIIMLTAKHADEDRAEAYEIGADAYITKPFNSTVLLTRIKNLLAHQQRADKSLYETLFKGIKGVEINNADEKFLKDCIACVQSHIADIDFDLPAFADTMCVSKSTLYKKLRAMTGLYTSEFIRSIRMNSACELLRKNPKARINDVAYAVGYSDSKYFSTCFKKEFGILPSEYALKNSTTTD